MRSTDSHDSIVYFQERQRAPLKIVVRTFLLISAAFFAGPVLIGQLIMRIDSAFPAGEAASRWDDGILMSLGFGLLMAVLIAVNNRRTFTVDGRAVRAPHHTIPMETIRHWRRLDGEEVRRKRRELLREMLLNPMAFAAWGLRGRHSTVFAPPWIPTALLIDYEGRNAPTLIGTYRPDDFLAALGAAVGPAKARAQQAAEAEGRRIREGVPPEIKEAARRVVDDLMSRHSSNGQVHGHHRKQHEQPPR